MRTNTIYGLLLTAVILCSCNQQQKENTADRQPLSTDTAVKQMARKTTVTQLAEASSDVIMHPEYIKNLARQAYMWGYPMVNMINRRNTITQAPHPGLLGGVLPVAPMGQLAMLHDYIDPAETFVTCPNQDVVYGLGFFTLDKQPVVIQVPDVGDRFWVYAIYDARTDQVGQLGKPYGSKPGFYLLHGPNWKGQIPDGIQGVIKSSTELANIIPRLFMDDTDADRKAIQKQLNQVTAYPLSEYTGKMKTIDWQTIPPIPNPAAGKSKGETKWVIPDKYFDQFSEVLEIVSPMPGEEALYGQFRALMKIAAEKPEIKKMMTDAVVELDKTLMKDFLQWKYNGKPAGNGWNRSQNNAQWGLDYYNRLGTSRSNMFDNKPNETQYFYTDYTTAGEKLKGVHNYKVTFPAGQLPPVQGFWSLTLYNDVHLFHPNNLKRYSLGTKNKTLITNPDGSLTLYAGTKSPGKDKEANWLPAPAGDFSLYIRAYWGEEDILNGTWTPPIVEKY